jgi:hypothetical protein
MPSLGSLNPDSPGPIGLGALPGLVGGEKEGPENKESEFAGTITTTTPGPLGHISYQLRAACKPLGPGPIAYRLDLPQWRPQELSAILLACYYGCVLMERR